MFEPSFDPPCDIYNEYLKPQLILEKVQEICEQIASKGENTSYSNLFDLIYMHLEDNFTQYFEEQPYA